MECFCFDKLLLTPYQDGQEDGVENFLKSEKLLCSEIYWEISRHTFLNLTKSFNYKKLPDFKLKKEFDCVDKLKLKCLHQLVDRHYKALNILEGEVLKTNQKKLEIFIHRSLKNILLHRNDVSNYIDCLKEYLRSQLPPLKNVAYVSAGVLSLELQKYQNTLKILQILFSFKDYYSADFDKDESP